MPPKKAPLVTGISPNEGPPGTKVKIRGENLGDNENDFLSLVIGAAECVLAAQWKSVNKIDALIPAVVGECSINVVTRSGGLGSSTVRFTALQMRSVALNEPCAVFMDESRSFNVAVGNSGRAAPKWLQEETDLLGLPRSSARISNDELNQLFASRAVATPAVPGVPGGGEEVRSTAELGNVHSTAFYSSYYLLANHADATFDELKRGLQHLRTRSTTRLQGTSSYLKTNLQTILDALTAIDTLRARLGQASSATQSGRAQLDAGIERCDAVLGEANRIASSMFADVLERKDRADRSRSALAALQRFKTLFGLADLLDRHVRAGDFHLVVSDYVRARSNFATSSVPLVRRVWNDVEARIDAFKDMLYRKLFSLPATFDEQKRILRFLLTLDPESGAIRDCLINEVKWLCSQLVKYKFEALQRFEADMRAGSHSHPVGLHSAGVPSRWQTKLACVHAACSFILDNYPHFMRLGHAHLNGTLLKDLDAAPTAPLGTSQRRGTDAERAKERQSVHNEWNDWNVRVVSAFVYLVRGALVPDSLDADRSASAFDQLVTEFEDLYIFDWVGVWRAESEDDAARYALLNGAVWPVRRCAKRLVALGDALPGQCQTALQRLAYDVRYATLIAALQRAKREVESLDERETWQLDNVVSIALDDTPASTPDSTCCVTQLPALFETIVNETFQQAFESVVRARVDEGELLNRQVNTHVSSLFGEVLFAFHNVLERLALSSQTGSSITPPVDNSSSSSGPTNPSPTPLPAVPLSSALALKSLGVPATQAAFDRRVLVVIANCAYTTHAINRRLQTNAAARFRQLDASRCAKADAAFRKLRDQLMRSYVDQKSDLIIGKMEQQLFATVGSGKTPFVLSWKPAGVRRFVKQTLLTLLSIHAELFAVAPCYLAHVLGELFERVFDELHRLYCTGGTWNRNGRLQALVDALFLKSFCAQRYFRGNTHALFDEICNVLANGPGSSEQEKPVPLDRLMADVQPLLDREISNDKFVLKCLLV